MQAGCEILRVDEDALTSAPAIALAKLFGGLGRSLPESRPLNVLATTQEEVKKFGQVQGWGSIEIQHATENLTNDYGHERVIELGNGRALRFSESFDYVRVTQGNLEMGYWVDDEFAEDAACVMGAVMGLARGAGQEAVEKAIGPTAAPGMRS